ncbi:MAG: hypothetical protein WB711_17820 [Terriglobales bacterium]
MLDTHLAHKAEHAVDLDTGAVLAVTLQGADQGDTAKLDETLVRSRDGGGGAGGARRRSCGPRSAEGERGRLRQLLGAGTPREWKNHFGSLVLTLYLLFPCRINKTRF